MFLSIIIPAYNCAERIERLLDSIVDQEEKDIEVVIIDDNSTDNFKEKLIQYKDKLNIKYYLRSDDYYYHCPGNTRRDGLFRANGDYVCFCDDDDKFIPQTLHLVHQEVIDANYPEMMFGTFCEYNDDGEILQEMTGSTWTHNNLYKLSWLRENNIQFKKDLYTHEDLYFSGLVNAILNAQGKEPVDLKTKFYMWMWRVDSLSRKDYGEEHYFIEKHLNDYIHCASDPFIEIAYKYPNTAGFAYENCLATLLYTYFYFEAGVYRIGDKIIPENVDFIQGYLYRLLKIFDTSKEDIIKWVYNNPQLYIDCKIGAFNGAGDFIEVESFKDFINRL